MPHQSAEETAVTETCTLVGAALMLAVAERAVALGGNADEAMARMIGRFGDLARLAPLIRFTDTSAAEDPAAARLRAMHGQLKRIEPLLSRVAGGR